jgi:hypothetical protein
MGSELRKIANHPVEILLGVRALPGARERTAAAPERAIFAAERASDLQLPATFLPNAAVGFSFFYPPLRGRPSLGKPGAFKESDNKQIMSWVVETLRLVESPEWDGGRTLTGWNGGIITMMVTPQPDAPNLMQLLVNWQSGIEGRRCAEFCSRLEEAYIVRGGYYDQASTPRSVAATTDERSVAKGQDSTPQISPTQARPLPSRVMETSPDRSRLGHILKILGAVVAAPFVFVAILCIWDRLLDHSDIGDLWFFRIVLSLAALIELCCGAKGVDVTGFLIPLAFLSAAPGLCMYILGRRLMGSSSSP